MTRPRVVLSWSSGKDSAWALHVLRQRGDVDVVGLLTTFNSEFARVAMHAVREELVRAQARAVRLPLMEVQLPWPCPNDAYEAAMSAALEQQRALGVTHVAFGDLFLEDIRAYREERLAGTGLEPLFPLWGSDTAQLAVDMIASGQHAVVVCVDERVLAPTYSGLDFDAAFVRELPRGIDPCGERGEFHTFAWDGPSFDHPVPVRRGEIVRRDGFCFADLLPLQSETRPLSSVGRAGDS